MMPNQLATKAAVKVKKLPWQEDANGCLYAQTELGEYVAWPNGRVQRGVFGTSKVDGGIFGAKAAAQADYERRALSMIEATNPESQQKPAAWLAEGYSFQRVFIEREAGEKMARGGSLTPLFTRPSEQAVTEAERNVLAERRRQVAVEGWTPEHDNQHASGELAIAAACYALNASDDSDGPEIRFAGAELWPWADEWWKPSDPRRDLVKAGALIIAEIERLDRSALKAAKEAKPI